MVGQVLGVLDETGLVDNTLVMVTGDNGALPGDRQPGGTGMEAYAAYGHRSSADWLGYKAHIWKGGHREPLITRWPGHIPAHTVSDALVSLVDFMATCADITAQELTIDCAEDSMSLLAALTDPDAMVRTDLVIIPRPVFSHCARGAGRSYLRHRAPVAGHHRVALSLIPCPRDSSTTWWAIQVKITTCGAHAPTS